MRKALTVAVAIVALGASFLLAQGKSAPPKGTPKANEKASEASDVDVLAEAREMNSPKFASPPREFRAGTVTPRELAAEAIERKKGGFTVSFPSGAPISTPAFYNGKIYVSGGFNSQQFYCLDAKTGALVWGIDVDDDGPSSAACEDGVTVFNTESCTIFAVDSETGKLLWSHWLGDPLMSSPTIAHGKVYASYPASGVVEQKKGAKAPPPGASHALACFDLKTGKILWQRWIDSDVMSSPVAVDKDLYATSFAGTVYRFKQETGDIVSAKRSRATSAPVVVGEKVFITRRSEAKGEKARELLAREGRDNIREELEIFDTPALYLEPTIQKGAKLALEARQQDAENGFAGGAPAAAKSDVALAVVGQESVASLQGFQGSRTLAYRDQTINCMGNEVISNSQATGKKLWSFKLEGKLEEVGGALAAPPAVAGDALFLATLTGDVLQVDPANGKVTKTHKTGHPTRFQPVVQDGRLYVGTQNGKLVCIDLEDKKFTGWTHWGGNAARSGTSNNPAEKKK